MALIRLLFVVLGLAHLRGCAVPLCEAIGSYPIETVVTRTGDRVLNDAVRTADGDFLVELGTMSLPPRYETTLVRMDDRFGPEELAKFVLRDEFGSGLMAAGDEWWFSLAGEGRDRKPGVYFVTSQAPAEVEFVEASDFYSARWLAFDGAEPRGLLVGVGRGGTAAAIEVGRGGVVRKWPMPAINIWGYNLWAAERLPDGRIALLSVDRDHRVLLRMLDPAETDHEPPATELRNDGDALSVTTAIAPDGAVALVVRRRSGELRAALFDPANPAAIKWHVLNEKEESGTWPRATVHDGKAIVAWTSKQLRSERVRARTFTADRLAGPATTIAPLIRRGEGFVALAILPLGDELMFFWQEDEVTTRRVPADFAGFALLEDLCERFLRSVI